MNKTRLFLILSSLLCIALIVFKTQKALKNAQVEKKTKSIGFYDSQALLIPGPFEELQLNQNSFLWPDKFNEKKPIRVQDLPSIYESLAQKGMAFLGVESYEFRALRRLSIAAGANLSEPFLKSDPLFVVWQEGLKASPSSIRKSNTSCSILRNEFLFRWAQHALKNADFKLAKMRADELAECYPLSFLPIFLKTEVARMTKDSALATKFIPDLKKYSLSEGPGSYSRYLAQEYFSVVYVLSSESEEPVSTLKKDSI